MSHDKPSLVEMVKSQESRYKAVIGNDCPLCQKLRGAAEWGFTELADELVQVKKINLFGRECADVLQGLEQTLRAVPLVRQREFKQSRNALQESIEAFDRAWKTSEPGTPTYAGDHHQRQTPAQKALAKIDGSFTPTGYWIVHDLLEWWLASDSSGKLAERHATTPILGASGFLEDGIVLWLTTELIPCSGGGPLNPDPLHLGLISIGEGGESSFLKAMSEVWDRSGLANDFRGRWRITFSDPRNDNLKCQFQDLLSSAALRGRSAQVATLCCLLAASGDPYAEGLAARKSERLSRDSAVTAKLAAQPHQGKLIDHPIEPVESVLSKIHAAKEVGIRNVVLAGKQARVSDSELASEEELRRRAPADTPFEGLFVDEAKTVGDVLDILLETNRHLRDYQAEVRQAWLGQWEGDTGTAKLDEEGPQLRDNSAQTT